MAEAREPAGRSWTRVRINCASLAHPKPPQRPFASVFCRIGLPPSWVKKLAVELEAEATGRGPRGSRGADEEARSSPRRAAEAAASLLRERDPARATKAEEDRISREEQAARSELDATEADLAGWQDVLSMAIRLAGNFHAAYLKARPSVRRRFNGAVLEAVYVKDRKIARAEFHRGVRASLLSPEFE